MNNAFDSTLLVHPIQMPLWLQKLESECQDKILVGDEAKMKFVIEVATENVQRETGGPFSAAIFDLATDRLVAIGINVVVPSRQSWAHAEMIAFSRAQSRLDSGTLRGCMLVSSCEPCAMCSGATPWSGVEKLVYGASRNTAEAIGFDEGYKGDNWREEFVKRGILVVGPLLEKEAAVPFSLYQEKNGKIY